MSEPYSARCRILTRHGYPSFSEEEIARRHAALRAAMARQGIALAVAYGAGRFDLEMLYLSNWPGGREGYVLLPLDGDAELLVQLFNHVPMAQRLSLVPNTRWAGPNSVATLASGIQERGLAGERIGLIGSLPFQQRDPLAALLPDSELVDFTPAYRELRLVRSGEEIEFFRIGAELSDRAMEALEHQLRAGLREYELAAIVEQPYLELGGYTGIHFMSATPMDDPQAFVPHQYQSDREIQPGDVLITEISGTFWGYAGQIHRTYAIGTGPTPEWERLHGAAVEAYDAIESVLRDGASVEEVLDAAEVIHERGYTIFDDLLHGANQYQPIVQTRQTDRGTPAGFVFRENMVVTIQPQLITPDRRMGLQFGETVRITREGVERLHGYKRELVVVDT
ncbi:MAG TPA: M24 family metallopeptidase [Chloroflexota bacterium]|nr:M24 family metallopeptidase [Chloroflexota bacterium]